MYFVTNILVFVKTYTILGILAYVGERINEWPLDCTFSFFDIVFPEGFYVP